MTNDQLTTLFGSKTRVKLLRHFLRDPGQKYFVRELTRLLNDHINAIRHELSNLESAGLVSKKKTQGKLFYRLNQGAPGVPELKILFAAESARTAPEAQAPAPVTPSETAREESKAPRLGDLRLLVQNGKFVRSQEAPADILFVGDLDEELVTNYVNDLEDIHGELRYTVMSEEEYSYRRQLFDRYITLMLSEPKKIVVNNLKDRQLARL